MQASDLNTQLSPVAGFGKCYMPNVKLRIEGFVANPVGEIGIEGNFDKPLPEVRGKVGSFHRRLNDAFEANNAVWRSRWVENANRGDVHGRRRGFHEKEYSIESTCLLHTSPASDSSCVTKAQFTLWVK